MSESVTDPYTSLLQTTDLRIVRGGRGSQFWGYTTQDDITIKVTPGGACLSYKLQLFKDEPARPFPLQRTSSVEEFRNVLANWVERVKQGY